MPQAAAAPPSIPPPNDLPASYEEALQALQDWVERIESGQLPLDEMLLGYQRAAQLLAFCRSRLEAVQEQVSVLNGDLLQPWKNP